MTEPLPVPWELNLGQLKSLPPESSLPFKDKPKDFPDRLWSRRNKHPIDEPMNRSLPLRQTVSPAGVAGEAEPRKEAGLAGRGWGDTP